MSSPASPSGTARVTPMPLSSPSQAAGARTLPADPRVHDRASHDSDGVATLSAAAPSSAMDVHVGVSDGVEKNKDGWTSGAAAMSPSSSSSAPAAVVELMRRRLTMPLLALFPQAEKELAKLREADAKTEAETCAKLQAGKKRAAVKAKADRQEVVDHNQAIIGTFCSTLPGAASVQLADELRRLETGAQQSLPDVRAQLASDHSQLQSTRFYAQVPWIMHGEEMQRVSAFARRDQKTVWDHVISMAISFQSLFSATTTMYVTILMGLSQPAKEVNHFLFFCLMWSILYPLITCLFLVPSTVEARSRVYLYEKMMDHGRLLIVNAPSVKDIFWSFYMGFFVFSAGILLYTSNQMTAPVNFLNIILQGATLILYYRSVYDVPSQLTPLVDTMRTGAKGCLAAFKDNMILVREKDVVNDLIGIMWLGEFGDKLLGEGSKAYKNYHGLLYYCLGGSLVISELGLLGFPDLSNPWTRVEPVVNEADRSVLVDKLQVLDELIKATRDSKEYKEQNQNRNQPAIESVALASLRMLLPSRLCGFNEDVKEQHEIEKDAKSKEPFALASQLPVYAHAPGHNVAADLAADPAEALKSSYAGWSDNEAPFSDVRMLSPAIAQAAADVVVAASRAGSKVTTTKLSLWNWREALGRWRRGAFWASNACDWLNDAEHRLARWVFARVRDAAGVAVLLVEIYGFYRLFTVSADEQCASFRFESLTDMCVRQ